MGAGESQQLVHPVAYILQNAPSFEIDTLFESIL